MKKTITVILFLCFGYANAQKQAIDVDLLSNVISAKQDELKRRVLSNIVVKNIRTTNYSTYNTLYNLVDIVTTEKNKTLMTQNILHQVSDYAVVVGLERYFFSKLLTVNGSGAITKRAGDNITYESLIGNTYSYSKKGEQTEQDKSSKFKDINGMNPLLLNDFLLDTLYQMLSKNTFLTTKGFFKKDHERPFFASGLDIDYSSIRTNSDLVNIMTQLEDFVTKINTTYASSDEVLKFINDSGVQFKDFKSLTNANVAFLLKLFDVAITAFRDQIGENNFIAVIGDIISKYVIFDMNDEDQEKVYNFKIDVEAVILAFEEKFYNAKIANIAKYKIGAKPFFTIGLNYGYFVNQDNSFNLENNTTKNITQIALAGEKVGVKLIFFDYKYSRSHPPLEWFKYRGTYRRWKSPQPKPLVNNFYGTLYASGVIYNIVNLRSDNDFKYATTGAGFGVEFFNGLEMNLSYVMPIIPKNNIEYMLDKSFINLGFDIPIFDYIKAARDKKK